MNKTNESDFLSTLHLQDLDSDLGSVTDDVSSVTKMLGQATSNAMNLHFYVQQIMKNHPVAITTGGKIVKHENSRLTKQTIDKNYRSIVDESDFNPILMSTKKRGKPDNKQKVERYEGIQELAEGSSLSERDYELPELRTSLSKFEHDLDQFRAKKESYRSRLQRNAVIRGRIWRALVKQRTNVQYNHHAADNDSLHKSLIFRPLIKLRDYIYPTLDPELLIGEVAFQLERHILARIFQERPILYFYNLRNIGNLLRILPKFKEDKAIQCRFLNTIEFLKGYGWNATRHPYVLDDVIHIYGTFPDKETALSYTLKQGWTRTKDIRDVVLKTVSKPLIGDILVVLDCFEKFLDENGIFRW